MNKIGFVMSIALSEIGCICFFITALVEKTIPVIGKMASQISDTKEYGELMYIVDYNLPYIFSILMIIVGVVLLILFYRRDKLV